MARDLIASDKSIKAIQRGDLRKRLSDGAGLFLLLFVKGGSHGWRFDYRIDGARKMLSLGTYPETTLAMARRKADGARQLVAEGFDPSRRRQAEKESKVALRTTAQRQARGLPPPDSFEAVAREWYAVKNAGWAPGYGNKIIRRLEVDVFPWLGHALMVSITAPQLLEVLRRIESRGVIETAHRALENCSQVFRYAVATGRTTVNPARDLKDALKPTSPKHFPAITDPERLGELLRACDAYAGTPVVRAALKLAPMVPVAVAFDAGNLGNVAAALREAFPAAALLVCGDDDRETLQRTGKNPGRDKAASAVRKATALGGVAAAVFPDGLPEGGTDFNDLATHAGADAVRAIVEPACVSLASQAPAQASNSGRGAHSGNGLDDDSHQVANGAPGADDGPPASDPFTVGDDGVWHTARDAEGNKKKPQWLCSRLDVTARTRADDLNGWGYLLEFSDPDGNAKTWAMPSAMLSGDGAEWAGRLRDMGLRIAPGTAPRNLIARYIDTRNPTDRVTCVERVGWWGSVYVLPSSSIGTAEGWSRPSSATSEPGSVVPRQLSFSPGRGGHLRGDDLGGHGRRLSGVRHRAPASPHAAHPV